jgi:hypothetical protein
VVAFSGDYQDRTVVNGSCAQLFPSPDAGTDAGPDWVLELQAYSAVAFAPTTVQIDLGPTPSVGTFSPTTVTAWSAQAGTPSGCEFSAGNLAVSQGTFELTLTDLSTLAGATGVAHGTLQVQQYVQAMEGTDCGSSDEELVHFDF